MKAINCSVKKCYDKIVRVLSDNGMDETDAAVMASHLLQADLWGIHTHGLKNLAGYIEKKNAGGVSFSAVPEIITECPSLVLIDANNSMGYIAGTFAMNMACEMAEKTGIAMAVVRNSCHYGAGACYANIAAAKGMIGIAMSNVDRKMAIPGTRGMTIGHNPFTLCAPANRIPSVCLDVSSSNVASLKVLRAKSEHTEVPLGWICDKDGIPTNDPSHYPDEGALLPMGNHKGYGIAFFIDILTGVLASSLNSVKDDIPSWCFDMEKPNLVSHAFVVINPNLLCTDFKEQVDEMIDAAHAKPKALNVERILVPGEDAWECYSECEKTGTVTMPSDVVDELAKILDIREIEA